MLNISEAIRPVRMYSKYEWDYALLENDKHILYNSCEDTFTNEK